MPRCFREYTLLVRSAIAQASLLCLIHMVPMVEPMPSEGGRSGGPSVKGTPDVNKVNGGGSHNSHLLHGVREGLDRIETTFGDIYNSVEDLLEQSTIAGQISPLLEKIIPSMSELKAIWSGIRQVVSLTDLIFLFTVSFILIPVFEIPYEQLNPSRRTLLSEDREAQETAATDSATTAAARARSRASPYQPSSASKFHLDQSSKHRRRPFRSTSAYHVFNLMSQVAKLALLVYVVDIVKIFVVGLGFHVPRNERITHAFSYVVYTLWAAYQMSTFKRGILWSQVGSSKGRVQVVDRLVDAAVYGCTLFLIMDILNVELGLALQSVLAFGSIGTLVFSFASQGIAKQLLYGILLMASDRIYEGDMILLGKSKFSGRVANLGWIETVIRGSDEIMVTIPNSDLLSERVSNLSRLHQCQVKQVLKFSKTDTEKLPKLLQDIKTEIRRRCPTVITDGSRPFRASWTSFVGGGNAEVTVDAHFRISPAGDMFWDNQQRCLQAIDEAIRLNDLVQI